MLQFISRTSVSADVRYPTNCYWPRTGEVRFNFIFRKGTFVLRTVHGSFMYGEHWLTCRTYTVYCTFIYCTFAIGMESGTNDKLTRFILHFAVQRVFFLMAEEARSAFIFRAERVFIVRSNFPALFNNGLLVTVCLIWYTEGSISVC